MGIDEDFMAQALELAHTAKACGEVPVGCVVVKDGVVIGRGYNQPISSKDPTAHAETVALRDAAKNLDNYRLTDVTLYVTLEPCIMCYGAMVHARVKRCVFGALDPKVGIARTEFATNHALEMTGGILQNECAQVLKDFFAAKR